MKNTTHPQDFCLGWDEFNKLDLELAHERQKELNREKNETEKQLTKILLSPLISKRKKKNALHQFKQICLRESIEQNAEELKKCMRT